LKDDFFTKIFIHYLENSTTAQQILKNKDYSEKIQNKLKSMFEGSEQKAELQATLERINGETEM
jgi:hypothetical protein